MVLMSRSGACCEEGLLFPFTLACRAAAPASSRAVACPSIPPHQRASWLRCLALSFFSPTADTEQQRVLT